MLNEYEKVKTSVTPKEFAKGKIRCDKRKYDNSSKFYELYFGDNVDLLIFAIKEYKRIHGKTHEHDEHCLCELLK